LLFHSKPGDNSHGGQYASGSTHRAAFT
jgi:hypothetical protein